MEQPITHALIAYEKGMSTVAAHRLFGYQCAGKDHVGTLRLKAGDPPTRGDGLALQTLTLLLDGAESEPAAVDVAMRVAS